MDTDFKDKIVLYDDGGESFSFPKECDLYGIMDCIEQNLKIEIPTMVIDLEYFIVAVIYHKKNKFFELLNSCLMTSSIEALYNACMQFVYSKALSAIKPNRTPKLSKKLLSIMKIAESEAGKVDMPLDSGFVFLAIMSDENDDSNNKIKTLFNKSGLTYDTIKNKILTKNHSLFDDTMMPMMPPFSGPTTIVASSPEEVTEILSRLRGDIDKNDNKKKQKHTYISEYCINLNELALNGKITELVGREREVNELIRVLCRKKKNNVILVGGEGVGKTAIAESIALKIVRGEVPSVLWDKTLVSLDMTSLMAGTTLRGMLEERVKGIMDEIKASGSHILMMDNIGAILADKGKNDFEISAMLSQGLENGDMQVIGTSDFASYRKTFDKDPSLARRFQKIIVEAPTIDESRNILFGIKKSYEDFFNIKYTDEAIEGSIKLANKYITDRNLPDSAIDVIDEAGALIGTIAEPAEFQEYQNNIIKTSLKIKEFESNKQFSDADIAKAELKNITKAFKTFKNRYKKERSENIPTVTIDDIMDIVSKKTNIPITNLNADDKEKLSHMNDRLKSEIIGQDDAIDSVCKALKRNRLGLHKSGCMYSSIIIGKTGTGKTLLAKKLAKELFGDESSVIRFDMSEFSDKVSVNKLIGSNPGYVGYEEGGQLTEKIKNRKYCVLLLDEIEKADPEIYNIFLQVLDEGFLTDNSGQKIDFKNVIVLFTSNVGAKTASDFANGIGFNEDKNANSKKILLSQLKKRFPPEFLNRIDDVIYFNTLTNENLKDIIKLELNKFENRLSDIGYSCTYGNDVIDFILDTIKDESDYGARPIIRSIQDNIENVITDKLIENEYKNGHCFNLCVLNNNIEVVENKKSNAKNVA